MAKMRSSKVVCKVGRTTSWLPRAVSSPMPFRLSDAFTPAAQMRRSAAMNSPDFVSMPSAVASTTAVSVSTRTPSASSSLCAAPARSSGSAGRMRGPASINVTFRRVSSNTSRP